MPRYAHFILDVLLYALLAALPKACGWSRRTSKALVVAGSLTVGLGALRLISVQTLNGATLRRRELAGAFLLAAQYQLTEEESRVRGAVAVIGTALVAIGVLARLLGLGRTRTQELA